MHISPNKCLCLYQLLIIYIPRYCTSKANINDD